MNPSLPFPRIFVLSALGLALALMFAISFSNLLGKPLSDESTARGMSAGESPAENAPAVSPEFTLSEEHMAEIGELMAKLKESPNDPETLIALGDAFLRARDWTRADVFLGRAVLSKPADIRPRYMLGIAQYRQDRLPEAIKTFEELLTIEEDPDTLYNLGIIYKYQVNNTKRAAELFQKIVASPKASRETVEKAQKELQ